MENNLFTNPEGRDASGSPNDFSNGHDDFPVESADEFMSEIEEEVRFGGKLPVEDPYPDAAGRTMFDLPNSKDDLITVVVPPENVREIPSQSIVDIVSHENDGQQRTYRGVVVEGPFHEPDGLRGDSSMFITTAVRGANFMPRYHGRVSVEVTSQMIDGRSVPPRFRPLPNSPVYVLGEDETKEALKIGGDLLLGVAIGHDELEVRFPSDSKSVLPRHTGILGTTGGGKSTTVSAQIAEYQRVGIGTILIDTEGEYTHINEPTEHENMIQSLERRSKEPRGIENTRVYHLVGKETSNPQHPRLTPFTLEFERLSPFMAMEILQLNEAQQRRYLKAYELAKKILRRLKLYPTSEEEEKRLLELDEMEEGYPSLTLEMMYDVVRACATEVAGDLRNDDGDPSFYIRTRAFYREKNQFLKIIESASLPSHVWSWRTVQGQLSRLLRLGVFDNPEAEPLNYDALTAPGHVSIIDLGDTDSTRVNNLVISELLRGVMEQQDESYRRAQQEGGEARRTVVFIEEAHEFLSRKRIKQMEAVFEQVARISRRGRKRWLGLTFVTQLPQHLPDEVLGLINNFVLHKITDSNVVNRIKRSGAGIDDSLARRLPNLAAGQAVVKMESMARPLTVAMSPTPCKLLMTD